MSAATFDREAEIRRQTLAGRLVDREVFHNVTALVERLCRADQSEAWDDYYGGQDPDWEDVRGALGAAVLFLDHRGIWLTAEEGRPVVWAPEHDPDTPTAEKASEDRIAGCWYVCGTDPTGLPRLSELETDDHDTAEEATRAAADAEGIDVAEYVPEVYEWWIVSSWLGRELAQRGEHVVTADGIPCWGRCTTGQAIKLDGVICRIAAKVWPDEWAGRVPVGA